MKRLAAAASALVAAALFGCAGYRDSPPAGHMSGALDIRWNDEDGFIYIPSQDMPLKYVGADGRVIAPGLMYTDGGSIPRVFWSAKHFSPWAYGPAYILHDWLFNEHRCGRDVGDKAYSFAEANDVLYDAIGVLLAKGKVDPDPGPRRLIKAAVDKFGKSAWDSGACRGTPDRTAGGLKRFAQPNRPLIDRIDLGP